MLINCIAACAHLSITVYEIQRDICEKIGILSYPLHSTPPLGGFPSEYRHPFGLEKSEWCGYPMVKKFRRYVCSFWRDPRTWQTDGQTDGHRMTAKTAIMHRIARQLNSRRTGHTSTASAGKPFHMLTTRSQKSEKRTTLDEQLLNSSKQFIFMSSGRQADTKFKEVTYL